MSKLAHSLVKIGSIKLRPHAVAKEKLGVSALPQQKVRYPPGFHTGFIVPTRGDVDQLHAAIRAAGFEAPAPDMIQRGGPPAYGF